jgi:hypothetical protein
MNHSWILDVHAGKELLPKSYRDARAAHQCFY